MSKYVHDLVNKMTMREKGYFKTMSSLSGNDDKNYLRLYKYVEQNSNYNQSDVREKFKDSSLGKYLSSEYNYLAEQLIKSLVNYHFDKSEKNKIRKSIQFINILIDKGLRKKALKILRHIKKLAYKNEYFSEVLTLIDLEEELLFKQGILGFTEKLKDFSAERQLLIDKINNLTRFRLLREEIKELWFQEGYLSSKIKSHPVLNAPILSGKEKAFSVRALEHWHYIVAMRDFVLQKHNNAISKFDDGIVFIRQHKNLFKVDVFLVYLSNYLFNCALVKDISAFKVAIAKLKTVEETNYTKYIYYSRSLEMYYQINDFKKSEQLDNEVFNFIKNNSNEMQLTQYNYIYFLLVRNKIIQRDFEKALDYINQWLQLKLIAYYYMHIKLFMLIIHLEMQNHILLKSEISTAYKILKRHKQYNITAKKMIGLFKQILRSPKNEYQFLLTVAQEFSEMNFKEIKQKNYKYFDYLIWVESRMKFLNSRS